jgi:hypothetical protein
MKELPGKNSSTSGHWGEQEKKWVFDPPHFAGVFHPGTVYFHLFLTLHEVSL